jgi:hypothetical protein
MASRDFRRDGDFSRVYLRNPRLSIVALAVIEAELAIRAQPPTDSVQLHLAESIEI